MMGKVLEGKNSLRLIGLSPGNSPQRKNIIDRPQQRKVRHY